MNEDYSEMVVELLCKKIDELEKEIKQLKNTQYITNDVRYVNSNGVWTIPASSTSGTIWTICDICGCRPCQCNKGTVIRG